MDLLITIYVTNISKLIPNCSHLHDVTGNVAQIINNTWKFGYMSWSQAFRVESMVDGRSFHDTDSHLLLHQKTLLLR